MMEYILTAVTYGFVFGLGYGLGYLAAQLRLLSLQNRAVKVLEREITEARNQLKGS